jgi:hypothetical protein
MRTLTTLSLGLALLGSSSAFAQQRSNFGQQVQQQLLNNLNSQVTGQPNYGYQNQGYPYQNQGYTPYQVQRPVYGPNGYQPPYGQGYVQPGYQQTRPGLLGQQAAQRYQLPAQYSGYAPGSTVSYGGANYVVNRDRTMSPSAGVQPAPAVQRYQIPTQYAGAAAGSTVIYGGRSYAINSDGTMSPRGNVR